MSPNLAGISSIRIWMYRFNVLIGKIVTKMKGNLQEIMFTITLKLISDVLKSISYIVYF